MMNHQETQWPRFEVFKQDSPKKVHQAVGSVHAPDAEVALLSARNVFVRRPKAVSLWVAPAEAIFSMTAQELEHHPSWQEEEITEALPTQPYLVFRKSSQRRTMTFVDHIGEVEAQSPKQALHLAIATFNDKPAWVWWIIPQSAISQSEPDVFESWFAPAWDKRYRHQSSYGSAKKGRKKK
jgi:ring-1,2-phenylacetyl-CoA epoxidase subunit PaaB